MIMQVLVCVYVCVCVGDDGDDGGGKRGFGRRGRGGRGGGGFGGGGFFGEFWLFSCEMFTFLLFLKVTMMEVVEGEEEALGDEGEGGEDLEVTVEVLVNYT